MNQHAPRLAAFRSDHPFRAAALAVGLCLATGSCSAFADGCSKGSTSGSSVSTQPVALTPMPAPAGLMAELFVPKPDAAWSKLRSTLGGTAALLPASFGAFATYVLGLPVSLMGEIDG